MILNIDFSSIVMTFFLFLIFNELNEKRWFLNILCQIERTFLLTLALIFKILLKFMLLDIILRTIVDGLIFGIIVTVIISI